MFKMKGSVIFKIKFLIFEEFDVLSLLKKFQGKLGEKQVTGALRDWAGTEHGRFIRGGTFSREACLHVSSGCAQSILCLYALATARGRCSALHDVIPVWDGNIVWLVTRFPMCSAVSWLLVGFWRGVMC